jgi:hypothetical protein
MAQARRRVITAALAALAGGLALAACTPGQAASGARHAGHSVSARVSANQTTIDQFTSALAAAPKTFAVTYRTTGTAPVTVRYAVRPPADRTFRKTPGTEIVASARGEYSCTPPARPGSRWTCQKLGVISSALENGLLDLYTPAHWAAFLKGYSLAGSFAGVKVTTSRRTVNGFRLRCADFRATGVAGTSAVCMTAAGIPGYIQLAGSTTGFAITAYSASPAASLFDLPPGATVTAPRK